MYREDVTALEISSCVVDGTKPVLKTNNRGIPYLLSLFKVVFISGAFSYKNHGIEL